MIYQSWILQSFIEKWCFFSKHHFQTKHKKTSFLGKFAFFPVKNHYIHHDLPFCRKRVAPLQSQRRYSPDLDVWHFSSPDFHRDQGQRRNLIHYLAASPIGVLAGQLEPANRKWAEIPHGSLEILPTQTTHSVFLREIPQNHKTFASSLIPGNRCIIWWPLSWGVSNSLFLLFKKSETVEPSSKFCMKLHPLLEKFRNWCLCHLQSHPKSSFWKSLPAFLGLKCWGVIYLKNI